MPGGVGGVRPEMAGPYPVCCSQRGRTAELAVRPAAAPLRQAAVSQKRKRAARAAPAPALLVAPYGAHAGAGQPGLVAAAVALQLTAPLSRPRSEWNFPRDRRGHATAGPVLAPGVAVALLCDQ